MGDEQVIKILEEIRDLQKEFLANQKVSLQNQQVSLQNQQESMARGKKAMERSKVSYIVLIVLVLYLGAMFCIPLASWLLSWIVRR
jgi:ABC-type antimicrobial peptide transport system permease subunit